MRTLGTIIIITGLLITVYTGFGFVTDHKEIHVDKLEVSRNKRYGLVWSPLIGVIIIALGGALLMLGPKNEID